MAEIMFVNMEILCLFLSLTSLSYVNCDYVQEANSFKTNPAPDGHRCGVCPSYYRKICAINKRSGATMLFDNHCIMDLYNCIEGTGYVQIKYDECVYFGNFAYVHGFKREDLDYGEDRVVVKDSKKNPDFVFLHTQ